MQLQRDNISYLSAQNSIEDNGPRVHHFTEPVCGYVIRNDGESDIEIRLLGEAFTVKPREQFSEIFTPFTAVEIDTLGETVPYRAYGRG